MESGEVESDEVKKGKFIEKLVYLKSVFKKKLGSFKAFLAPLAIIVAGMVSVYTMLLIPYIKELNKVKFGDLDKSGVFVEFNDFSIFLIFFVLMFGILLGVAYHLNFRINLQEDQDKKLSSSEEEKGRIGSIHIDMLNSTTEVMSTQQKTALRILEKIQAEQISREQILSFPKKYVEFLKQVQDDHKSVSSSIRMCGSMVGFAYLMPEAIAKHITEEPDFEVVSILATDIQLKYRTGKISSFYFAVYTVARIIEELVVNNKANLVKNVRKIDFEIRYTDHDVLAAIIEASGNALVVLQALNIEGFEHIITKGGKLNKPAVSLVNYQLGFRYDAKPYENNNQEIETNINAYNRYSGVLDSVMKRSIERTELWRLEIIKEDDGEAIKLTIINPLWKIVQKGTEYSITKLKENKLSEDQCVSNNDKDFRNQLIEEDASRVYKININNGEISDGEILNIEIDSFKTFLETFSQCIRDEERVIKQLQKEWDDFSEINKNKNEVNDRKVAMNI